MSGYIKYLAVLVLIVSICCYANAITINQETAQSGITGIQTQEESKSAPVNTGTSVISIIVAKIDNTRIYARDGKSFPINDSTEIINNHNPKIKLQTGELFFRDGNLIMIIIK